MMLCCKQALPLRMNNGTLQCLVYKQSRMQCRRTCTGKDWLAMRAGFSFEKIENDKKMKQSV